MRRLVPFSVVLAGLVALSGCAVRQADLTAISTRNVKLDGIDLDRAPGKRVWGVSKKFVVLFIPLGMPTIEEAVDDALDRAGGDFMTDAVVYTDEWSAVVIGQQVVKVKGTVVDTRHLGTGASR
ncbi:hypothetical protein G3N55_11265 [Dissulfurirhabdus thermomarina]|uniref:Lipoprotein n=1 Tax=Dissulfurirhabdus thermomarina TaxID=1765737 RepID=A0A6N9TVG5_DISTH|nr:hypothetical protein [Dissulfurirhabdus thermomarina]NDY43417.1 hypothetical protein [Dissulfurirhabdus thermomarina]NMX23529.1 hypothetical protein [Dissulfurirhabdus thermomarina]